MFALGKIKINKNKRFIKTKNMFTKLRFNIKLYKSLFTIPKFLN